MTSKELLAPCPFCGGLKAEIVECEFTDQDALEEGWDQTDFYFVACPCGAQHGDYPGHSTPALAIAAWNGRHDCADDTRPLTSEAIN